MPLFTRSDVVTLDLSEVEEFLPGIRINQSFQVAIVVLLVYDASKQNS